MARVWTVPARRLVAAVLVWPVLLAGGVVGCGSADRGAAEPASPAPPAAGPHGPGDRRLELSWAGTPRTYRVHAPPGYDPARPVPVVIVLHFRPGTGDAVAALTGFDAVADREGFLVAYPEGVGGSWNALLCCGQQDDVGFLDALAGQLVTGWNADPDRVFLAGISNGGDMAFRAAVEKPGRFAAIGVVSGGFVGNLAARPDYAPTRPVSVVTVTGTEDSYATGYAEGVGRWQQRLRCVPVQATPAAGAPAVTVTRRRCADGSETANHLVRGMGHAWPGATQGELADPDAGVAATDVLWEFFAAHPRRG